MLKFINNFHIKQLANKNNCENIVGVSFIFIPGVKNKISNLYVIYLFHYNSNAAFFIKVDHKPRVNDVLLLFNKLGKDLCKDSFLVANRNSPWHFKEVLEYLENNFAGYHLYKSRYNLGNMYLFHLFLEYKLKNAMVKYKKQVDDLEFPDDNKVNFSFMVEDIYDLFIDWNNHKDTYIKKLISLSPGFKELTSENNVEINKNEDALYKFNIDIKSTDNYEVKLHLYPQTACDVDNLLLESIYHVLKQTLEINVLGDKKIILINILSEGNWYTLAKSLIFSNNMSLEDFLEYYRSFIFNLKNRAYPLQNIDFIAIKIVKPSINLSDKDLNKLETMFKTGGKREYSTIRPLKIKQNYNKNLGVLDIETIIYQNRHIPYAIGYKLNNKKSVMYYITDFGKSLKPSSDKMMKEFMKDFIQNASGYYIYCHNLGAFDGYLLLKDLYGSTDNIKILMDGQKKFISIDVISNKIRFRDSLRILPSSLDSLSKLFDVPIKKGYLDHEKVDKSCLLNNEFKQEVLDYLEKDLTSLLSILVKASESLLENYKIDFTKCYSASSMAMKIYRTNFMKDRVHILPPHVDKGVRESYRGGATETYKCIGKNLYYYDVNSLYPLAMTKPLPYKFLRSKNNPCLDNFYGFIYADIYAPTSVFNPFLPFKDVKTGNVLYPHGKFSGIYYSEELKLAASKGYEINCKFGYQFSKNILFSDYVEHFYDKKSISTGGERFLYKLFLNSIYGYLGRSPELRVTEVINKELLPQIANKFVLYDYLDFIDNKILITRDNNQSRELQLLNNVNPDYNTENIKLNNNVAIASAITSEARIVIANIKTNKDNPPFYTDTDSVFLQHPLPESMIGNGLGQFKDELNGSIISEALFLGPKIYGYKVNDIEKVVIAGVKPGVVSYEELTKIWKGETIIKQKTMITKQFTTISIANKTSNISLKLNKNNIVKNPVYYDNGYLSHYLPIYLNESQ